MAKKQVPNLVVNAKVRNYAKACGEVNVSDGFVEGLNARVAQLIETAVDRAAANKRKTLRGHDA